MDFQAFNASTKINSNSNQANWNFDHDISSFLECEKLAPRLSVYGAENIKHPTDSANENLRVVSRE